MWVPPQLAQRHRQLSAEQEKINDKTTTNDREHGLPSQREDHRKMLEETGSDWAPRLLQSTCGALYKENNAGN